MITANRARAVPRPTSIQNRPGLRLRAGGHRARAALVGLLLADGAIHVLLAPEHFAESPVLGMGFLLSGLAQGVLAGLLVRQATLTPRVVVAVLSAGLLLAYGVAITRGLPLPAHHSGEHMMTPAAMASTDSSAPESVTLDGLTSKALELAALALALVIRSNVVRRSVARPGASPLETQL